jgi:hypothetical protein
MISFNTQTLSQPSFTHVINNHITVQAAAEATGYNIQYLRRLMRPGKLEGIKNRSNMVDRDAMPRNISTTRLEHF